MLDLNFHVEEATVLQFAAAPSLAFKLNITSRPPDQVIHTIALDCQIQVEAGRRHYTQEERKRMLDVFGEPDRWSQTLRSLLWASTCTVVTEFKESALSYLAVPCTLDFNLAATKYFEGLEEGEVPLCFVFSGTVFYAQPDGSLQVASISRQRERYKLPVQLWREMMDIYYPDGVWLRLSRHAFDRLHQYKVQHELPTWDALIKAVIPANSGRG